MPIILHARQAGELPCPFPSHPRYTERDLVVFAEYLAREMRYDPELAAAHGPSWYQEQVGPELVSEAFGGLLRRFTIHECEAMQPLQQALREEKIDPFSIDWAQAGDAIGLVVCILLLFIGMWVMDANNAPPTRLPAAGTMPGLTEQQFRSFDGAADMPVTPNAANIEASR